MGRLHRPARLRPRAQRDECDGIRVDRDARAVRGRLTVRRRDGRAVPPEQGSARRARCSGDRLRHFRDRCVPGLPGMGGGARHDDRARRHDHAASVGRRALAGDGAFVAGAHGGEPVGRIRREHGGPRRPDDRDRPARDRRRTAGARRLRRARGSRSIARLARRRDRSSCDPHNDETWGAAYVPERPRSATSAARRDGRDDHRRRTVLPGRGTRPGDGGVGTGRARHGRSRCRCAEHRVRSRIGAERRGHDRARATSAAGDLPARLARGGRGDECDVRCLDDDRLGTRGASSARAESLIARSARPHDAAALGASQRVESGVRRARIDRWHRRVVRFARCSGADRRERPAGGHVRCRRLLRPDARWRPPRHCGTPTKAPTSRSWR